MTTFTWEAPLLPIKTIRTDKKAKLPSVGELWPPCFDSEPIGMIEVIFGHDTTHPTFNLTRCQIAGFV